MVYIKWEGPGWYGPYSTRTGYTELDNRETWYFISRCATAISELARQEGLGTPKHFNAVPADMQVT